MSDQDAVIEIKDLTKRYGEFVALDSFSLNVKRGQILGFIGPNGAGKDDDDSDPGGTVETDQRVGHGSPAPIA